MVGRYVQLSMDFDQNHMFSRTDALARGYTDDDLRRGRASGELVTVRRGHFIRAEVYRTLDAHRRHAVLAEAIFAESSADTVFSHVSAAVLHGMETWDIPLDKVTFTIGRSYAGKRGRQRVLHGSPVPSSDLMTLNGFAVTTPARTVVDLARSLPLHPAVCVGDYALRTGLTTHAQLLTALDDARNRTGVAKARQAVGSMSPRSQSAGESRSRMQLDTLPLPPPQLGQWLRDEFGLLVARVPFLYPDHGVVGIFEGQGLYGADPVIADVDCTRQRKRMRNLGWVVVQWNWEDLAFPRELTDRIARAFVRAAGLPAPRGSFT